MNRQAKAGRRAHEPAPRAFEPAPFPSGSGEGGREGGGKRRIEVWCLEERQEPGCSVQKWGPEQGGGTRGGCWANDWGGQLPVRVPARTGLAPGGEAGGR